MKIKDMTIEQAKEICLKARTKPNGKVVNHCVSNCPLNNYEDVFRLFDSRMRLCDLIGMLNKEVLDE